jgi:hypothetical protein
MSRLEAAPEVTEGAIVAFRLFDVAYAIDLAAAEALWARAVHAGRSRSASRSRLSATPAKAVAFGVPPVLLTFDPVPLDLGGIFVEASATARLYDFGVVSFALRVPVTHLPWASFVARVNTLDAVVGSGSATAIWGMLLDQVRTVLAKALERPVAHSATDSTLEEDYLVGIVTAFSGNPTAAELQRDIDLAPLLSGETRQLSDGARADLMRQRFSYYIDDLVVLTWDRAFIYEPRGDADVMDVIEVANAQLLEMRYYDELLDGELPRMYDLVQAARRTRSLFGAKRFADLARRLYTLVAEVTELTEKVDNALQVTEDVYLARIYSAALELFRVRLVSAAVERKLAIIRDTYTALYDEASSRRAELLELLITVLIAAEIVLALLRHG